MFGSSGFSGASGSTGEHGRPGRDGEHGADGYNGDDIDVFVDVYYDSIVKSDLIKVFVENVSTRKQLHYLIHSQGGSLLSTQRAAGEDRVAATVVAVAAMEEMERQVNFTPNTSRKR